ncbi:MAG: Rv3654c family TadE-like protein [Propionibacteriaceae bacterium]
MSRRSDVTASAAVSAGWSAPRGRAVGSERGTGTVLAVGLMVCCLVLLVVGATIGGYLVAGHRARSAADLAALAGAAAYRSATSGSAGSGSAGIGSGTHGCPAATVVARANGARLVDCDVVGDSGDFVITVGTEVDVGRRVPGLPAVMRGRALAGPLIEDP